MKNSSTQLTEQSVYQKLHSSTEHLSSSNNCIWRAERTKNIAFFIQYLSTFFNYQSTTYLVQKLLQSFFSLQKLFCQIFDQRLPPKGGQRPPRIGHKCLQNRQAYLHDATKEHDIQYIIILLLLCRPLLLEPDKKNYLYSCHQLQHCTN